MLSMPFRNCRMLSLGLLLLCLRAHNAAFLRNERSVTGNPTNDTNSLPANFQMVLSLKGEVNQFPANIVFHKLAFETLYACLCQKDTYSCSGHVTFIYGSSYNYNTQNITRVPTTIATTTSTMYKCEIPDFGLLSNNRGGHFICTRADRVENACTTSYWSIYIGQCDLGFANVIWNPNHQARWSYTNYNNKSQRDIVSSLICGADKSSSYADSTLVTSSANLTTSPRDVDITTNVLTTTTTNPRNAGLKNENNEGAVIGGAVAAVVVFTTLFVVGVVWSCILLRRKKKKTDMNKLAEEPKQNNRKPLPDIPTRNRKPAGLYVIPEAGMKPEEIPRWSHSRRKDDDDTTSSIYDVIGSGVYENDISMNGNTSINNNTNNKSPFDSSMKSDKVFSLTVTNGDYVPGSSKLGSKDNNIYNSQNQLPLPKLDMKQRQRQPIPTEEPSSQDSTGQESSGFSLGRYFQENYNFLNRPAELRRVDNTNNKSDVPSGENYGKQNNTRSSELVYPLNIGEYGSDGAPYFKVDKYDFPYDSTESGGTLKSEDNFQDAFTGPRDSLHSCHVSISDRSNGK